MPQMTVHEITKLIGLLVSTFWEVLPAQMNVSYPATANRSIESNPVLWSNCIPHQQFKGGISVVDPKSPDFQWAFPNSKKGRCVHKRLGSDLSGNSNRRAMGFTGTTSSYKCIGNEGRKACFAIISQAFSDESYLFPNKQYNRLVLSCEDGGTKKNYLIDLAEEIWQYPLHHGIKITTACLPSSMKVEADWQLRNSKDQSKWKLLPQVFQSIFQRKTRDGSFCFSTVSTTSMVHCMETRSIQSGNGCCARNLVQSVPL